MSTPTGPTISGFQIQGTFSPKSVAGAPVSTPVNLIPVFANLTVVEVLEGTYTPNNDELTIKTFSSADSAEFLLLIVDGVANVVLSNSVGAIVNELPVNRFFCFSNADLASPFTTLILDGRTSAAVPMVQSAPVDYTLIIARATVT
jgi:hypothetical protein